MSNKEIKGNLARLLATENLVVEHRSVPTASFDVDRRVLTLPNWDKASNVVYDMFVGHDMNERADMLVCEVIADNVISEGMIKTVNHAHDQLLNDGATVIPKRACLHGVLIQDKTLSDLTYFPDDVNGFKVPSMKSVLNDNIFYPSEEFARTQESTTYLSNHFELFDFNFTRRVNAQDEKLITCTITDEGEVHGILLYFTLNVDDDIVINSLDSTSCWIPKFIPLYGGKKAQKGDEFKLKCSYTSGLPFINVEWL